MFEEGVGERLIQGGRAALVTAVLGAGGCLAATATATAKILSVGPVQAISFPGSYNPHVSVSAGGRILAAWGAGRPGELIARFSRAGKPRWSGAEVITRRGVTWQQAIGRDGTAAILMLAGEPYASAPARLSVAIAPPGHMFGRAQLIVRSGEIGPPVLAVRPDGSVVVAWPHSIPGREMNPAEILYSVVRAGTPASPPQLVGLGGPEGLSIAQTKAGAVLLAYGTPFGGPHEPVNRQAAAATLAPGAERFGTPLSARADQAGEPYAEESATAAEGGGRAALITTPPRATERRALAEDGSLGAPLLTLAAPPATRLERELFGAETPVLAPDGSLVRAWVETRYRGEYRGPVESQAVVASVTPEGATQESPPQDIFRSSLITAPQGLEMAAFGGYAVATWQQLLPPATRCEGRVYFSARSGHGFFWPRRPLSAPIRGCGVSESTLSGAGSTALAAWVQDGRIFARRFYG